MGHQENKVIDRMLFDHESDLQENVNIAGYPEMQTTIKDLSERIKKFMESASFRRGGKSVPGVTSPKNEKVTL